jgi:hypothetical protein
VPARIARKTVIGVRPTASRMIRGTRIVFSSSCNPAAKPATSSACSGDSVSAMITAGTAPSQGPRIGMISVSPAHSPRRGQKRIPMAP